MKKNNQGFTLLESLLVMLCVSVFFMVPFLMVRHWREQTAITMFFNRLEREIEKTHQSAIVESKDTWINQDRSHKQLIFNYHHHQEARKDYLAVEYPLVLRTTDKIEFNTTTGNIKKIQTIKIEDTLNNGFVQYSFQFGSGKVIKSEIKQ